MVKSIVDKIEQYQSEKIAIVYEDKQLTYKVLHQQANQVAHYLLKLRSENPDILPRVAFYMQPSDYYVIAILGALKAGFEFLPLDVNRQPQELEECLRVTNIQWLLADNHYQENNHNLSMLRGVDAKYVLPSIEEVLSQDFLSTVLLPADPLPRNYAYIIYTSGSSGKPKAVYVHHDGILPRIESIAKMMQITENDCYAQLCAIEFDASLQEIFTALASGATLKIIPINERKLTDKLMSALQAVTAVTIVPSELDSLDPEAEALKNLRAILTTGSALSDETVRKWISPLIDEATPADEQRVQLFNGYGATENTFGSHLGEITLNREGYVQNHLGLPMQGIAEAFRVISETDDIQDEQPTIDVGILPTLLTREQAVVYQTTHETAEFELVTYVTAGQQNAYLDAELTAKAFKTGLIDHVTTANIYFTGDVVTFNDRQQLCYKRRITNSDKRFGKLIDLEKINNVLKEGADSCNIKKAYAILRKHLLAHAETPDDLIVFYEIKNFNYPVDFRQLNSLFAYAMLQDFPTHTVAIKEIPVSASKGTIDKKALIKAYHDEGLELKAIRGEDIRPLNPVEKEIAEIWREVLVELSPEHVFRADDNFLNYYPESLKLVSMLTKIIARFQPFFITFKDGKELRLDDGVDYQTIKADGTLERIAREVIQWLNLEVYFKSDLYIRHQPVKLFEKIKLSSENIPEHAEFAIVLIHSVSGSATTDYQSDFSESYQNLAPGKVAIYKMNAPVVDGHDTMPYTIEELARHYLVAIYIEQEKRSFKHVRLVGWSTGGVIVYEMLNQIQSSRSGSRIKGLPCDFFSGVMIDSAAPMVSQKIPLLIPNSHDHFKANLGKILERMGVTKLHQKKFDGAFIYGVPVTASSNDRSFMFDSHKNKLKKNKKAQKDQMDQLKNKLILQREAHEIIVEIDKSRRDDHLQRCIEVQQSLAALHLMRAVLNYRPNPVVKNIALYVARETYDKYSSHDFQLQESKETLGWSFVYLTTEKVAACDHMSIIKGNKIFQYERQYYGRIIEVSYSQPLQLMLHRLYQESVGNHTLPFLKGGVRISDYYIVPSFSQIHQINSIRYEEGSEKENMHDINETLESSISLQQLLCPGSVSDRCIVYAKQGVGKTALLHYLKDQWSSKKLWPEIDMLFIIPLYKIKAYVQKYQNGNLIQFMLFLLNSLDNHEIEVFLQNYFNKLFSSLKVYFLLDSYNEVVHFHHDVDSHENQLLQALLKQPNLLITTQEQSLSTLRGYLANAQGVPQEVALKGLDNMEKVQACAERIFDLMASKQTFTIDIVSQHRHHLREWFERRYQEYKGILDKPLLLFIICTNPDILNSLGGRKNVTTLLYENLCIQLRKHYLLSYGVSNEVSDDETLKYTKPLFELIQKIALSATLASVSSFDRKDLEAEFCDGVNIFEEQIREINKLLGGAIERSMNLAIHRSSELIKTCFFSTDDQNHVQFLHDSLKYFLAAQYLTELLQNTPSVWDKEDHGIPDMEGTVKDLIISIVDHTEYYDFLMYLIGLFYQADQKAKYSKPLSKKISLKVTKASAQAEEKPPSLLEKLFKLFESKIESFVFEDLVLSHQESMPQWVNLAICMIDLRNDDVGHHELSQSFIHKLRDIVSQSLRKGFTYSTKFLSNFVEVLREYPDFLRQLCLIEQLKELELSEKRVETRLYARMYYRSLEASDLSFPELVQQAAEEADFLLSKEGFGHALPENALWYLIRKILAPILKKNSQYFATELNKSKYRSIMLDHLDRDSNPLPIFYIMYYHQEEVDVILFEKFCKRVASFIFEDRRVLTAEMKLKAKFIISDACYIILTFIKSDNAAIVGQAVNLAFQLLKLNQFNNVISKLKLVISLIDMNSDDKPEQIYELFVSLIQLYSRVKVNTSYYEKLQELSGQFYNKHQVFLRKKILLHLSHRSYPAFSSEFMSALFNFLSQHDLAWLVDNVAQGKFSEDSMLSYMHLLTPKCSSLQIEKIRDYVNSLHLKLSRMALLTTKVKVGVTAVRYDVAPFRSYVGFFEEFIKKARIEQHDENEWMQALYCLLSFFEERKDSQFLTSAQRDFWFQQFGELLNSVYKNKIYSPVMTELLMSTAINYLPTDRSQDLIYLLQGFITHSNALVSKMAIHSLLRLFAKDNSLILQQAVQEPENYTTVFICLEYMLQQSMHFTFASHLLENQYFLRNLKDQFAKHFKEFCDFQHLLSLLTNEFLTHHVIPLRVMTCKYLLNLVLLKTLSQPEQQQISEAADFRLCDGILNVRVAAIALVLALGAPWEGQKIQLALAQKQKVESQGSEVIQTEQSAIEHRQNVSKAVTCLQDQYKFNQIGFFAEQVYPLFLQYAENSSDVQDEVPKVRL